MSGPSPRLSDCHPDRKHVARGYCASCYTTKVYRPTLAPGVDAAAQRAWRARNPGKAAEYEATYNAAHPGRRAAISRKGRLKTYGLTPATYDELLAAQGGVCAICQTPPGDRLLHVDHAHDTGAPTRAPLLHV